MSSSKLLLNFNQSNFSGFLKKISDLTSISDTLKIKVDSDNIFIYAINGETIMISFKNYLLKTKDIFIDYDKIDTPFDIVISNAKKWVKNLSFIKTNEKILFELNYRLDKDGLPDIRMMQLKNGKLKLSFHNGESSQIKDINLDMLDKRLNIKNKKWSFNVKSDDFQDIKKLSNINSDSKVISVSNNSGFIKMYEDMSWELIVDESESNINKTLMFNKSHLSSINDMESIEFIVFDTFLLIKDNCSEYQSNFMISSEQDFDGD